MACLEDIDSIINFICNHWQSDHIYVKNPSLFRYDFVRGNELTLGILELESRIEGIFGYFYYNESPMPDIGGMLWRVSDKAEKIVPLAGVKLRNYVLHNIPHRFFGSPGAGAQTEAIYRVIKQQWIPMQQYLGKAEDDPWPEFVRLPQKSLQNVPGSQSLELVSRVCDLKSINPLIFEHQTPIKDYSYLLWRYFFNPFHHYYIWKMEINSEESLLVVRMQRIANHTIMRVIDYIGNIGSAAQVLAAVFFQMRKQHRFAYVDFVCSGFDSAKFTEIGFHALDFEDKATSAPNLFEPLVLQSKQVFANANFGFDNVTMVRGNGDQDRPNTQTSWSC